MPLHLTLALVTGLQLLVNLGIQLAVLRFIGAGRETDAYLAAQAVPMVVFAIITASLQNIWQPRLAAVHTNLPAWAVAQRVAQGQVLLVFGPIAALLWLTSESWVAWMFMQFTGTQRAQVIAMTLPLLAAALISCHAALLTTALRARERYLRAEAVGLAGTTLALATVIAVVPSLGIEAAAWITLARACVVYAALFIQAEQPLPDLRGSLAERRSWHQMRPLMASSMLYKTSPLVDRFWSSQASAGGMTLFGLAQMGIVAAATVIERAICMPVNSKMGRAAAEDNRRRLRTEYRRAIKRVTIVVVLAALALVLLLPVWNEMMAAVLRIDAAAARQMWWFVVLSLGQLHVAASGTVCVAVFYAMADTTTPSLILVVGFATGVALKSAGFLAAGLEGLAAAGSAYHLINLAMLVVALERKLARSQ